MSFRGTDTVAVVVHEAARIDLIKKPPVGAAFSVMGRDYSGV
jgi:hypothetical protein